jgi:RNA methyltransferase, TrmH family
VTRRLRITSAANPRLKALRRLRRRGHPRAFLAEGYRQLVHALDARVAVREVYSAPELHLGAAESVAVAEAERRGAEIVELGADAFDSVAGRTRPDGLISVVARWPTELGSLPLQREPLVIVAEAIERPGNLGTIVRTACAASADALVVTGGRAGIFHPETVQGSVGALFRVRLATASSERAHAWARSAQLRVVVADPAAPTPYWEANLTGALALVVGNERNGVSPEWRDVADEAVSIPMGPGVDSLNVAVAAGVLLFEASRQRSIASGVSSASDPSTTSASASASASGGNDGFGIATTRIPAARALRMPLCESSTAAERAGPTPSRRAASR